MLGGCITWSIEGVSGRKQREQRDHQREADRKHPLTSRGADPFGGSRRAREQHGAHRPRDQIFAADQWDQPVRRLGQESRRRGKRKPMHAPHSASNQ
jgi:hypothetical protein